MKMSIRIIRNKPSYPPVIAVAGKRIFIVDIYKELATSREKRGWSDWTAPVSKYNKFKYTSDGMRLVFVTAPKGAISIGDFAKAIEKTRWFRAMLRWLKTAFVEVRISRDEIMKKILACLEKPEIIAFYDRIREVVDEVVDDIEEWRFMRRWNYGIYDKIMLSRKETISGDRVNPITIMFDLEIEYEDIDIIAKNTDVIELILETVRGARMPAGLSNNVVYMQARNVLKTIGYYIIPERLYEDWEEKFMEWLLYHKHFPLLPA